MMPEIKSEGVEQIKYEIPKWFGIVVVLLTAGFVMGTLAVPTLVEILRIK